MSNEGPKSLDALGEKFDAMQREQQDIANEKERTRLAFERSEQRHEQRDEQDKVRDERIAKLQLEVYGNKHAFNSRETALKVEKVLLQDLKPAIGDLSAESKKTKDMAGSIKTVQQFSAFAEHNEHCIRKDRLPRGVDLSTVSRVAEYTTEANHDGNETGYGRLPTDTQSSEYSTTQDFSIHIHENNKILLSRFIPYLDLGVESFLDVPANRATNLKSHEAAITATINNKKKNNIADSVRYAAEHEMLQSKYGMLYLHGMPKNVNVGKLEVSLTQAFTMAGNVVVVHANIIPKSGKSNGTGWIAFWGTDAQEKAKEMLPQIQASARMLRTLRVHDFDPELAGWFYGGVNRRDVFRQLDNAWSNSMRGAVKVFSWGLCLHVHMYDNNYLAMQRDIRSLCAFSQYCISIGIQWLAAFIEICTTAVWKGSCTTLVGLLCFATR